MNARPRRDKAPTLFWHAQRETFYIVYYHPQTNGRAWRNTKTADHKLAEQRLAEFQNELGAAALGLLRLSTAEQARVTVGDCLDLLEADYQGEERRSLETLRSHLKIVRAHLGQHKVKDLTLPMILAARKHWRAEHRAKPTINRYMAALQRGIKLAYEQERIARIPPWRWPLFNTKDCIRQGFVEAGELAAVNAHEPYSGIRDMNTWAFLTGMRWSEARLMTWSAYDPTYHILYIHPGTTKNGEGHPLPLPIGPIRDLIARRFADRHGDYIFHAEGRPIRWPTSWRLAWRRAGLPMVPSKRSGRLLPAKCFHDLRRSGLRNLIMHGVDEKLAMQISGHKTRSVFDRYNIIRPQQMSDALAKVSHAVIIPELPPAVSAPGRRRVGTVHSLTTRGRKTGSSAPSAA